MIRGSFTTRARSIGRAQIVIEGELQIADVIIQRNHFRTTHFVTVLAIVPRSEGRKSTIFSDSTGAISRIVCKVAVCSAPGLQPASQRHAQVFSSAQLTLREMMKRSVHVQPQPGEP